MPESLRRLRESPSLYLAATIVLIGVILTALSQRFLTLANLFNLLTSYAYLGILSGGLLVVLISGSIDISFTAIAATAQYVMMSLLIRYGGDWPLSFALAGGVGVALGLVNAILVHNLRISSIIVTIATLNVFFGILIFVTHGDYITDMPQWFADGLTVFDVRGSGDQSYAVSIQIAALVAVFVVTWLLLEHSTLGRQIYAMGSSIDAAQRMGLNILRLRLLTFGYMGLLAGVASVIQAQLTLEVAPTALMGRELDVVAAVVLGGASLAGGVGTVLGTILGVALLAEIQNGFILVGVSSYWSQAFVGFVILVSVSATALRARRGTTGRLQHV